MIGQRQPPRRDGGPQGGGTIPGTLAEVVLPAVTAYALLDALDRTSPRHGSRGRRTRRVTRIAAPLRIGPPWSGPHGIGHGRGPRLAPRLLGAWG